MSKSCILLIFLLGLQNIPFAQELSYRQISTDQGLPSNEVYSVIQDKNGFIWFGCDAGLFRYDGIRFIPYRSPKQKSKSVAALTQTPNGRIYCHNFTGQVFYVENDQMFVIEDIGNTYISNIMASPDNNLYMTSSEGLIVYNYQNNTCQYLSEVKFYTSRGMVDTDGNVWFTGHKSGKFNPKEGKATFLQREQSLAAFYAYFQYEKQIFLIHTLSGEMLVVEKDKLVKTQIPALQAMLLGKKITNIFVRSDKIWVSTYSGLLAYDLQTKETVVFLESFSISSFYQDQDNGLWVSTLYDGILYIPESSFLYWKNTEKALKITHNGKEIFFGDTKGNLHILNPTNKEHKIYNIGYKADIRSLNYSHVDNCVYFNANSNIFSFQKGRIEEAFKGVGAVKDFLHTPKYAFFATSAGTFFIENSRKKLDINFINHQWGRYLLYDSLNNTLWIASNKGLYRVIEKNKSWIAEDIFFQDKQILGISQSPDFKKIYAISFEGILYELNEASNYSTIAKMPEGVQVYQILYHQNKLILGSNRGIWIRDLQKQTWTVIDKLEGLLSDEILSICVLKNLIWISTPKGVQSLPLDYSFKKSLSKVFLRAVLLNDEIVQNKHKLHLGQEDRISLKLETIAYYSADKFQYAYRINAHTRWTYLPANSEYININNLPKGEFRLEVKAIDHKNRDSENIILLEGYVFPPIWQRTWFLVGSVLVISFLITFFFKRRLTLLQARQETKLKQIALENELKIWQQTALQVQMNPHFLFNILNSIKAYIYENDKKNAILYLNQFADLVRKILHHSNYKHISLAEEIEMLTLYISLEAMLLGEDFSWKIDIDDSIDTEDIFVPTLLIQPFVENAFKHGLRHKKGEKKLFIGISIEDTNTICILIEDNGIGRKLSAEINQKNKNLHQSFATQNIQKRIALLNQNNEYKLTTHTEDLYNDEQIAIGTRVHINFMIDEIDV